MKCLVERSPMAPLLALAAVAALSGLGSTGPAAAQEPAPEAEEDRTCICLDDVARQVNVMRLGSRARLGVILGEETDVAGHTGVRLEQVLEGTPARRAGLREGDVVVALDGEPLGGEPAGEVVERMTDHEPGDTVEVTFFREGDERTARVVADEAEGGFFSHSPGYRVRVAPRISGEGIRSRIERQVPRLRERGRGLFYLRSGGRADLELVEVNPELGRYFGTERGVLVAEIEDASSSELRIGDVILAIDGREVEDPAHVRSILASYRDDEAITFEVVRDGRTIEVEGRGG